MKFPLSWLKTYLPTKRPASEIAQLLTLIGLEVDHFDDEQFEVSLTPNLAHCNSIRGIARELAAISGEKLKIPEVEFEEEGTAKIQSLVSVAVEAKTHCPRYACRLIEGVKVVSSPAWLQEKIEACGMRSVNAVVDITNLVMLELGQPLHAFDFATIEGKQLVVRSPKKGETVTTLDKQKHHLSDEMLLICDTKGPVAIAGVMGALHTEISDATDTILLESAYFEPTQVRRTSKRTSIQSEASHRFERGVDPNAVVEALDRAAALICTVCGGKMAKGVIDVASQTFEPHKLTCRLTRINQLLGTKLAMSEVVSILRSIDLVVTPSKQDLISVLAPTYRHDLNHEIDLVEEVARFYGYDNIHQKGSQPTFRMGELSDAKAYSFETNLRQQLLASGLQELLTCDLISPEQAELMTSELLPKHALIHLLNPCSQDQSVMRPSLLPGLLHVVKHNADYQTGSVKGFEIGRVHFKSKSTFVEQSVASIILSGHTQPFHWASPQKNLSFFDLKGIIENLMRHIKGVSYTPSHYPLLHPGQQATLTIQGMEVGVLGQVHPLILKTLDMTGPIYFAELNLEDLAQFETQEIKMTPLALYPQSTRDWTLTLHHDVPIQEVFSFIEPEPILEDVSVLDLYHGEKLGSEWKNITLRFIYRDRTKTIDQKTVEEKHHQITQTIRKKLKGKAKDE